MSKIAKTLIIIAVALVLVGSIIFCVMMAAVKWDFSKLGTVKYESNTYEVNEEFSNISLDTDTEDIFFVPSDDGKCKVVCYESENLKHSVTVKDGALTVSLIDTRKWYEHIGFGFGNSKITVYLPDSEYSALKIEESTGDIEIPAYFKFRSIDISVSTGDVKCYVAEADTVKIAASTGNISVQNTSSGLIDLSLSTGNVSISGVTCSGDIKVALSTGKTQLTNITCKNVISSASTGDIYLKNVIASEKFSIERDTGDVNFDDSDAAEIFVETDTGDVRGSLLTEKVFITKTDTGSIDVPKSTSGGICEITTDTGNIRITVK